MFIAKQRRNRSKRNRKRVRVRFSENGKYAHGSVAAASFRTSFSSGPVFLLRNDRTPTNGNRLSGPRRTYFRSFDRRSAGPTSCPERSDSSHSYTTLAPSILLIFNRRRNEFFPFHNFHLAQKLETIHFLIYIHLVREHFPSFPRGRKYKWK